MNSLALKAVDVHVSFGSTRVLTGVSVEVKRGSFSALLGANGSGKSTFVRATAGLIPPERGSIEIAGYSLVRQVAVAKRRLGVLFDGLALFDDLSIWDHALLIGRVYNVPARVLKRRCEAIFRDLGLWTTRGQRVREASFGTQKKCAIALALLHRPDLIILDEPFEGLDPPSVHSLVRILKALAGVGSGILVVSHILEIVESIADDFWVLGQGRIEAHWNSAEVRSDAQPLLARFTKIVGENPEPDLSWIESPHS
jgi:ABC-2 type transport system ATP-binding protein